MTLAEVLAAWQDANTRGRMDKESYQLVVQRRLRAMVRAKRNGADTEEMGVVGDLSVNGKYVGTVIENDALRIRAGNYRGVIRYVSGKKFVQGPLGEMAESGDFLLEIVGDGTRSNLLIHTGTKPQHSEGCILAGAAVRTIVKYKNSDGKDMAREVISVSGDSTLAKLRSEFYGVEFPRTCPSKVIRIEIRDI